MYRANRAMNDNENNNDDNDVRKDTASLCALCSGESVVSKRPGMRLCPDPLVYQDRTRACNRIVRPACWLGTIPQTVHGIRKRLHTPSASKCSTVRSNWLLWRFQTCQGAAVGVVMFQGGSLIHLTVLSESAPCPLFKAIKLMFDACVAT
jgi:hypothetical protein